MKNKLKILTHRAHCGHQYELWKLPHEFRVVKGISPFYDFWNHKTRPFDHPNVSWIDKNQINVKDFDLMIIHIDEYEVCPIDHYLRKNISPIIPFFNQFDLPRIYIMHGAARLADEPKGNNRELILEKTKNVIGQNKIVCNSDQQKEEWNFPNSKTIYHGFDQNEFIRTILTNKNYYINPATNSPGREECNGAHLFEELQFYRKFIKPGIAKDFTDYKKILSSRTFFFNFTQFSPMPRNRGESLMSGNIIFSPGNYNWKDFIKHGKNGFICDTKEEFIDSINYIEKAGYLTLRNLSVNARKTAIDHFNIYRYLADWQFLLHSL